MERADLFKGETQTPIMVKSLVTLPQSTQNAASVSKSAMLEEAKREASGRRGGFRLQQQKKRWSQRRTSLRSVDSVDY